MNSIPRSQSDATPIAEQIRSGELQGVELVEALRRETDLAGIDLSGCDLSGADLSGLQLFKANLSGAFLRETNLQNAELSAADLSGANLESAKLCHAGLGMANLSNVNAFGADLSEAALTGADLSDANFCRAKFTGARLREAKLIGADFTGADLRNSQLSLCDVAGAIFDNADLRDSRLRGVRGFESALWYGADIRDINFSGAYRLHRHVIDENYLREFREISPLHKHLYTIWSLTSDCGRSLTRWCGVILMLAVVFAGLFALTGAELAHHDPGVMTYFYFSLVTLTTLGYGDITPNSSIGQALVLLEVCVGYLLLGGLISIFANKMARRGP